MVLSKAGNVVKEGGAAGSGRVGEEGEDNRTDICVLTRPMSLCICFIKKELNIE